MGTTVKWCSSPMGTALNTGRMTPFFLSAMLSVSERDSIERIMSSLSWKHFRKPSSSYRHSVAKRRHNLRALSHLDCLTRKVAVELQKTSSTLFLKSIFFMLNHELLAQSAGCENMPCRKASTILSRMALREFSSSGGLDYGFESTFWRTFLLSSKWRGSWDPSAVDPLFTPSGGQLPAGDAETLESEPVAASSARTRAASASSFCSNSTNIVVMVFSTVLIVLMCETFCHPVIHGKKIFRTKYIVKGEGSVSSRF